MTQLTIGITILTGLYGIEPPPEVREAYYQVLALEEELRAKEDIVSAWIAEQTERLGR